MHNPQTCWLCRKTDGASSQQQYQPAGHTGVDYAQPAPPLLWQLADTGYMFPAATYSAGAAATWDLWEKQTPIFHEAVIAHNLRNQDRRMEELNGPVKW